MMNINLKQHLRKIGHKYKFYLIKFDKTDESLYVKFTSKDKQGFNVIIEKTYPTKGFFKSRNKYFEELETIMSMSKEIQNIDSYEEYIKQLNK